MKEYTIDFSQDTPNWQSIEALCVGLSPWLPESEIKMEQKVSFCPEALFVYQEAEEDPIRAEYYGDIGPVCNDSCMEFFLMPENADKYLNFEWNFNGCLCLGFGTNRYDRIRPVIEKPRDFFGFLSGRKEKGWWITYRIPVEFLRKFYPELVLQEGQLFRANCYKCGDRTVHPHYLCWNRVDSSNPDFHRPESFGKMVLGRESETT